MAKHLPQATRDRPFVRLSVGWLLGMAMLIWVSWGVPVAWAASSAAIRAIDDAIIEGKNFAAQDWTRAEFNSSDLSKANFKAANLRGAVLNGVNLQGADWREVNFADGIAYLSNFRGADLRGAIFTSALLLRSRFDQTQIEGADFSQATLDRVEQVRLCAIASGINPTTGVDTRDSLECP